MATKLFGKDLKDYEDMDVEQMLDTLTAAEIEELNNYVDPDVSVSKHLSVAKMKMRN